MSRLTSIFAEHNGAFPFSGSLRRRLTLKK